LEAERCTYFRLCVGYEVDVRADLGYDLLEIKSGLRGTMPRISKTNLLPANDLAVRAAVARDGKPTEYKIADSAGLTMRVEPSGRAAYYVRYTTRNGRKRCRIGTRDSVALKDARQKAREIIAAVGRGEDPVAIAKDRAESATFRQMWEQRKEHGEKRSARTIAAYQQVLDQYVMDEIGNMPVDEITRDHLTTLLRGIQRGDAKGSTNEKGSKHRASMVRAVIGSTYRWGRAEGIARTNPTLDLGFHHNAEPRDRTMDADEVGRLYRAIDGEPTLAPKTRIVLKLLLLTGQRNSTVTGARVDELKNLDCANPTWVIKRARMKGKRDHSLPLPPLAAQLFRDAVATNGGSEFVFPSEGEGNHLVRQTVARAMQRVCARAEITGLRAHDFRRSINSWLHDGGVGYDVRSRLMAHSPPDITSLVYDQSKLIVPLREALLRWEKHVIACASPSQSRSGKVLAMMT
jgi:integrase